MRDTSDTMRFQKIHHATTHILQEIFNAPLVDAFKQIFGEYSLSYGRRFSTTDALVAR